MLHGPMLEAAISSLICICSNAYNILGRFDVGHAYNTG